MKKSFKIIFILLGLSCYSSLYAAPDAPTDIQQPGTQPGEISNLESPGKCDNCHGGYNTAVEPAHNWRGSMMAHAGRDPIFWATMAIAEQDFPGSGDLCLRCHSTTGWLAGRSTPTDGSGLAASDSDGVDCDFCHKLTNPDNTEHPGMMLDPFVANEANPDDPDSVEGYHGSGMASMWGGNDKLGPYADAEPKHKFMMSRFHRSVDFCGTCHDVSNSAVGNLAHNNGTQKTAGFVIANGVLGGPVDEKAAFNNPPYKYGVVERTFSEYKAGKISQTLVSEFPSLPADLKGGALQAIYDAATANGGDGNYEDGTPRYYSCQSCHMRPVAGKGANKRGIPTRSDMPLHDMTGGNYWMPSVIEYLDNQGKLRLGGGMSESLTTAMLDGALRAKEQLNLAASLVVNGNTLKVINHTGHKLISGYPEGRRMWLNIKWYDGSGLLHEDGAYGPLVDGNDAPVKVANPAGGPAVQVESIQDLKGTNTRIYEAHYGLTKEWASQLLSLDSDPDTPVMLNRITGEVDYTLKNVADQPVDTSHESFHFVLNNTVIKDNRIPPYGMSYETARIRNALPVPASQYGNPGASGNYDYFDEVSLNAPSGAQYATIDLLYQPTSWEYIQFLYLANKGTNPDDGGNAFLGEEGANMLDAWLNAGAPTKPGDPDLRMAKPYVMASATWGTPPGGCEAPTPTLLTATPGDKQAIVTWQEIIPVDQDEIDSYKLYYDQSGKAQLVADLPWQTGSYTDTGLTNGHEYCYKVTTQTADCESSFSNILCATPAVAGQATAGVAEPLLTGKWVTEGKGKNATTTFIETSLFTAGDAVVIRGAVKNKAGEPLSGAVVHLDIQNEGTVASLISAPSDSLGKFEVTWQTQKPNKKGQGGTPAGIYSAVTTDVAVDGYSWNGVLTNVNVTIE